MPPRPPVLAMLAVLACARAHDRSRVLDLARARRGSVAPPAAAATTAAAGATETALTAAAAPRR